MKRLTVIPLILLVLLAIPAKPGEAKPHMLTVTIKQSIPLGSFNANSKTTWTGAYGISSWWYVDNPTLNPGEEWQRNIGLFTTDGSKFSEMGIEKCGSASNNCLCKSQSDGGDDLFVFVWSSGGFACWKDSQGDPNINQQIPFGVENNSNNTGTEGICETMAKGYAFDNCIGNINNDTGGASTYFTLPTVWGKQTYYESITASFTNHKVWGGHWEYNRWRQGNVGAWNFQTVPSSCQTLMSGCPNPVGNPPQMYWSVLPADNTTGGQLSSCDYPSGTTCIFRG